MFESSKVLVFATLAVALLFATACEEKKSPEPPVEDEPAAEEAEPATEDAQPAEEAKPADEEEPDDDRYAADLCEGYIECYAKHEYNGNVDGKLNIDVNEDGVVTAVSYEGSAAKPIQDCLIKTIKERKLVNYSGAPGSAFCQYSGMYNNGTQMLSNSWGFKRKEAAEGGEAASEGDGGAEAPDEQK